MADTNRRRSRHRATARTTWRLTVAVGSLSALTFLAPTPAGAQQDPYGNTTTTTVPDRGVSPTCSSELTVGSSGDPGEARVEHVASGGTVRLLIGGAEAGRATAPSAAEASTTTIEIPFTIPDLPPGQHTVVAVGVDFTLTCDPDGLEVLGATEVRDRGLLPRTGISLALLVVVAVVLLIVGLRVREAARRRRIAKERARRSADPYARPRS